MKKIKNLSSKMADSTNEIELSPEIKCVQNKNKFVENTQRVIGMTNKIVSRISNADRQIANMYSDIPGLLQMAGDLLVNMGDEIHTKMLHAFLKGILIKKEGAPDDIPVWKKIKSKDDTVLTENLSVILSENPFVPRIQYIYGANPARRRYVSDTEVETMWKLITALVHNSIKYAFHGNHKLFTQHIPDELISEFRIQLD